MKKNLLSVVILALLVVNIVLTSVMMFSMTSTNKKTAELVSNIATVLNLELTPPGSEAEKQVSLEDTAVYNMTNSMTLLLKTDEDGKTRYLMCEVALSMDTTHEDYEKYGETISDKEKLIEDAISTVVSSHTAAECQQDFESIKAEILDAIQDLFQSDFIYKVAVSNIKIG